MSLSCEEREKCGSIIHMASGAAALIGSGMAQFPLSDAVLIAPIQIKMLTALGTVFGIKVTESAAKGLCASLSASCIGRATSQLLVGWVPILGNLINATTAAGITEAMGWLAVEHFQTERAKRSIGEAILRNFPSDSEFGEVFSAGKKKWKRLWRKVKHFLEERIENLEEKLKANQSS